MGNWIEIEDIFIDEIGPFSHPSAHKCRRFEGVMQAGLLKGTLFAYPLCLPSVPCYDSSSLSVLHFPLRIHRVRSIRFPNFFELLDFFCSKMMSFVCYPEKKLRIKLFRHLIAIKYNGNINNSSITTSSAKQQQQQQNKSINTKIIIDTAYIAYKRENLRKSNFHFKCSNEWFANFNQSQFSSSLS